MAEAKKTDNFEREYIIPLRRRFKGTPRYKKTNKAVKAVKEFLVQHMKIRDKDLNKIKVDRYLNDFLWMRGIRNPPSKVRVKVSKEGEIVKAELAEYPDKLKFKKARLEKRSKKATEVAQKTVKKEEAEQAPKEEDSQKKEKEEEKKAAVVETGKALAKKAAKTQKHQTKTPKPKVQQRKQLSK